MKCYIVLFGDGSMMLFNKKQKKEDFNTIPSKIKMFEVEDETQIIEICEWQAKNYQSPFIKEVSW